MNNLDRVFAYGDIAGALLAGTSGSPNGGQIGSVQALGNISGLIAAESSIGTVAAGGSVTATLIAPDLPTPTENNTALITNNPPPSVPASIAPDLLSAATAARDQLFADRTTFEVLLADLDEQSSTARQTAANNIAQSQAAATDAAAKAKQSATAALTDAGSAITRQIESAGERAQQAANTARTTAAKEREILAAAVEGARQAAAEGYLDAQRLRDEADVELQAADVALEEARQQAHETFIRNRAVRDNASLREKTSWNRRFVAALEETVDAINVIEHSVWGKWWANDPSALGENVETVTGFTPVAIIQSISNLTYDLVHFQADGDHVKNIGVDALGAIPVIGRFKAPIRFATKAFGALKRSRPVSKILAWSKRAEHVAEEVVDVASKGVAFTVDPRVAGQLSDSRLGSLAGKITPERLHELVNNNAARRFFDTRTGNINVIQEIEGKLVRITVAGDKFKIISVGPIRERNILNLIKNGGFVP